MGQTNIIYNLLFSLQIPVFLFEKNSLSAWEAQKIVGRGI